ncbi:MAG: outer membrane beta-barrel protein [Chitinophagales bacterium]|nr:outer membrane beta-barrel protein [Chitinophagales bacterium]
MKLSNAILIFLLSIVVSTAQAQFTDRGRFMLGSAVGFGTNSSKTSFDNSSTEDSEPKNTQWNVSPYIGYFLFDNFTLGIGLDYTSSSETRAGEEKTKDSDLLFGPFTRYYIPFGDKALFLQGNFGFGNSSDNLTVNGANQNINTNILAFGIGPGFTIFSNDGIGLEALVKYNYAKSQFDLDIAGVKTTTTTRTNQIALSLGIQIYFAGLKR